MADFSRIRVSIVLLLPDGFPYRPAQFWESLQTALDQDHPCREIIVVDGRAEPRCDPALDLRGGALIHLKGAYVNRAAMFNAALRAASGDFLLLLFTDQVPVILRRSAAQTMLMAAMRRAGSTGADQEREVGLVYADYERIHPDGRREEVHLLDWHPGRCRDTVDFGAAVLCPRAALERLGGFDETCRAADWYDLRLRLGERYSIVHVANRFAGSLYAVVAPPRAHNVFDYLLSAREAQLELERVFTEHLKRIGAYLAPGAGIRRVEYTPQEEQQFAECLASVVIPVYRRPQFIGQAIESVQAQTERRVEVIVVVNGGPDDPTADEVRRYLAGGDKYHPDRPPVRLIVVDVNNLGLCLNAGIAAARGKYYVQLDSDDRLKPHAVARLLEVFEQDATVGMVIGSYEVWTLDEVSGRVHRNEEIPVVTHDEWTPDNGRNNLLRVNGAGAPRAAHIKVIKELGWFGVNDTPWCRNYGEDYDLVLRISEHYTIGRVFEPIYEVIRHSGGTDHCIDQATIDRNDEAKDHMRLEALRRRQRLNRSGGSTPEAH
jgi:glycosyltransferase involved in cell wall biosynthesis